MSAAVVFGREEELGSIEAFLDELRPRGLLIAGEPGIGKTILWEAGVEAARGRSRRVLAHRAVEPEAKLSFTALSDLIGGTFDESLPSLSPPRRRALEVALLLAEPGAEAPDPRAIALAFLDVLRTLTASAPILLAIDDLQWVDPASAQVLQFALRRLEDEPVAVLASVRADAAFAVPGAARLELGPLSLGALHHLLKARLEVDLPRPELVRLGEMTAGNPFFALEVARELRRAQARLAPGRPLPVPANLRQLIGERLARLSDETREVLLTASALARPSVGVLEDVHAEAARDALEEAARAGVVELDGSSVRFAHPLLRASRWALNPEAAPKVSALSRNARDGPRARRLGMWKATRT